MIEVLVREGAGVDALDKSGNTALHVAAKRDHKDVVELLVSEGAAVSALDKWGKTALHRAVEGGHKDVVDLLQSLDQTPSSD